MTELPSGWASGPLSDFIQPRRDRVSPANAPDLPFIGMDHVEAHTTRIIGSVPAGRMKSSASRFSENNVLYGRLRPYLNKVAQPTFDGLASAEFIVFIGNELIDPGFLCRRLNTRDFVSFASHLNEGDRPRVSFEQIGDFRLWIPPLNEQRRIVERIDALFAEIDRGVESLRMAKQTIGLYRQSLLKSAFEGRLTAEWRARNPDKFESPDALLARIREERERRYQDALDEWEQAVAAWRKDGEKGRRPKRPKLPINIVPQHISEDEGPRFVSVWDTTRFGDLNVSVSDGPFGSNLKTSDYADAGIRVIRLENIGCGEFLEKTSFISEEKYLTIKKHTVFSGSIIVSSFIAGSIRSCIVPDSIPLAVNKADCFAVNLSGEFTNTKFAAYFLQSPQVFKQFQGLVHGVGRPRINTTQLKELHFPLCSSAEQAEIVRVLDDRLEAAEMLDREIDTNLVLAEALRQSILKIAFFGQLVLQDPDDEPVSALLARIRSEPLSLRNTPRQRRTSA